MSDSPVDHGFVLRSQGGHLIAETFDTNRWWCWAKSFGYLSALWPGFGDRYWKRERASKAAARRRGWRVVRAKVVVAK